MLTQQQIQDAEKAADELPPAVPKPKVFRRGDDWVAEFVDASGRQMSAGGSSMSDAISEWYSKYGNGVPGG